MIKKMKLGNLFLISIILSAQAVYGEPLIQINSYAKDSEIGFLSKKVVYYVITNPSGQRFGYDPISDKDYDEFDAGWSETGIDDVASIETMFPPTNGIYTIEIIGSELMAFSLSVSIYRGISDEGLHNLEIEGVIGKGLSSIVQVTYNSYPAKQPGDLKRIATPSSLKQDITLSHKVGWIENEGITNSLLKKVEAVEASIAKGKNDTAKNQLNALVNEINAQKGKQIDEKAVKMFLEDVQYIVDQLK